MVLVLELSQNCSFPGPRPQKKEYQGDQSRGVLPLAFDTVENLGTATKYCQNNTPWCKYMKHVNHEPYVRFQLLNLFWNPYNIFLPPYFINFHDLRRI